jgi:phage gp16-like protein
MSAVQDDRRADLAKIHLAKKQLGLSDEDYRSIMLTVAGARSAAELSYEGRLKLLAHFQRCGWRARPSKTPRRPQRPTPSAEKIPLVRRIRAQLISLGNLPDEYADGIATQMFRVDRYEWCHVDQLHAISAALGVEQRKKGAPTA